MKVSQASQGNQIWDLRKDKPRVRDQNYWRGKIQVSSILNLIQNHVLTGTEINTSRLVFGMKLLNKVLPDALPENYQPIQVNLINPVLQQSAQSLLQSLANQTKTIAEVNDSCVLSRSNTLDEVSRSCELGSDSPDTIYIPCVRDSETLSLSNTEHNPDINQSNHKVRSDLARYGWSGDGEGGE